MNNKCLEYLQQEFPFLTDCQHKSASESNKLREVGNNFYTSEDHNEKIHRLILYCYSKSAAFAPSDSEEYALALSNRSQFLLHIKKYELSINDINQSLSVTKSIEMRLKLTIRKVTCLVLTNKNSEAQTLFSNTKSLIEEVKNELNKKVVEKFLKNLNAAIKLKESTTSNCMNSVQKREFIIKPPAINGLSGAVKIAFDDKNGLHMVAQEDISPGEIILIENSFSAYPDPANMYTICSDCLKVTYNSIPCKTCAFAVYCSDACMKNAWEKYHSLECLINPYIFAAFKCPDALYCMQTNPVLTQIKQKFDLQVTRLFIIFLKENGTEKLLTESRILKKKTVEAAKKSFVDGKSKTDSSFALCYSILNTGESDHDIINMRLEYIYSDFVLKLLNATSFFCDDLHFKNNFRELQDIFLKLGNVYRTHSFGFQIPSKLWINYTDIEKAALGIHVSAIANNLCMPSEFKGLIGSVFSPLCNILNHSCHANVERFFMHGVKTVMYAERPIKKNEQIYLSYGPNLSMDINERTLSLLPHNFQCRCIACLEKWPTLTTNFCAKKKRKQPIAKFNKKHLHNNIAKPFEEMKHDQETADALFEFISSAYTELPTFEAAVATHSSKSNLFDLLSTLYGTSFKIPGNC